MTTQQNATWGPRPEMSTPPKKRMRYRGFVISFVIVQLLFLAWVITGALSGGDPKDCGTLDAQTCESATQMGTAVGVGLVIGLWAFVDFLMGLGLAVWHLARRR